MQSILLEFYKEPSRPISQKELAILHKKNFKNLKLGYYETYHESTGYFYLLKNNGKKEKSAIEKSDVTIHKKGISQSVKNIGTCSVTWKLNNTPVELRDIANSLIDEYCRVFRNRPLCDENRYLNHYEIELTRIFYIWLYYENYNINKPVEQDIRNEHNDKKSQN